MIAHPLLRNASHDDVDEHAIVLRLHPPAPAAPEQRILAVKFRSPDARYWNAVGGGATVAAAIIYARESCPDDAAWDAFGWNDLYGE